MITFASSSRIFSSPGSALGSGLGRSALGTYLPITKASLQEKLVCCGEKLERGEEGGKEERNAVFQLHLDPLLGIWASEINQKNVLPLKDIKSGGGK